MQLKKLIFSFASCQNLIYKYIRYQDVRLGCLQGQFSVDKSVDCTRDCPLEYEVIEVE